MVASMNSPDVFLDTAPEQAKQPAQVTAAATDCSKQQMKKLQVKYQPLNCMISMSCQLLRLKASHISDAIATQINSGGGSWWGQAGDPKIVLGSGTLTQQRCPLQAEFEGEKFEKYGEWREAWGCLKIGDVRLVSLTPTHPPPPAPSHSPAERHLSVHSDALQRVMSNLYDTCTIIIHIGCIIFVVVKGYQSQCRPTSSHTPETHIHNVETRFYCPRMFLSLDFSVGMAFLH